MNKKRNNKNKKTDSLDVVVSIILFIILFGLFIWWMVSMSLSLYNKNYVKPEKVAITVTKKEFKHQPKEIKSTFGPRKEWYDVVEINPNDTEIVKSKDGLDFIHNKKTDEYYWYYDQKHQYWKADETYIARNWGSASEDNLIYNYKNKFYRFDKNGKCVEVKSIYETTGIN